jgi:hypothetical protein
MTSRYLYSLKGPRILLAALASGILLVARAAPAVEPVQPPVAPAALQPGAGEHFTFSWHAIGSQIYECRATDKGGWAWTFVAPEADLYNLQNEKMGTHGAGPHWAALDGSRTQGSVKARADGARATDIPLLLLSTTSTGGAGKMATVTSVQRLNTQGGVAPATGCTQAGDSGKRTKEAYSADYVFFSPQ